MILFHGLEGLFVVLVDSMVLVPARFLHAVGAAAQGG